MKPERVRVRQAAGSAALVFLFTLLLGAAPGHSEVAWVKDELRLNVRTGPGVQYRIVGVLKTGDMVEILARGEGWTQVQSKDSAEGWIPVGYLQPGPPARVALAWGVHAFTASGAVVGTIALLAIAAGDLRSAALLMLVERVCNHTT